MKKNLFAYGTLEVAEVILAITGKTFDSMPATLHGYARYLLKDQSYPGIVSEDGACTRGTLYRGLDLSSIQKIDNYEDTCYTKELVEVQTIDGEIVKAFAFVVPESDKSLLSEKCWDKQDFVANQLESFLRYI